MPTTTQKYVLNQRHQLIDLNKTFKNFKLQFQVVSISEPVKDFYAVVLNQEQLDGITDLNTVDMKLAKGKIGGTIVADNNKYQNYFLVLRSQGDDTVDVEVLTNIEEIEPKPVVEEPPIKESFREEKASTPTTTSPTVSTQRSILKNPWFWVLIVLVLLGAGYYYYVRVYKNKQVMIEPDVQECVLTAGENIETTVAPAIIAPSPATTEVIKQPRKNAKQNLYNKLAEIA